MNKRSLLAILLVFMLVFTAAPVFADHHGDAEEMYMEETVETDEVAEEVEEAEEAEEMEEEATEEEEAVEEAEEEMEEEFTAADMIVLTIDSNMAMVDGEMVTLDVAPFIAEGRTMVPLAFISRQMGADVAWDGEAKAVTYTKEDTTIVLTIDSTTAMVNGEAMELDSAPVIVDGRTMVPVKFVGTLLGYDFAWDAVAKTVTITVAVEAEEMEEVEEEVTEEEVVEEEAEEVEEEAAEEEGEEEAVEGEEVEDELEETEE